MITIAQKFIPFSHKPGTCALIPGTHFEAEIFPALMRLYDLSGPERKCIREIPVEIEGPLHEFVVSQDLERGCLTVRRNGKQIHILPSLQISQEKKSGLPLITDVEKLSLGSHKKLDWEKVLTRCDFTEIFPLWLRIGGSLSLPKRTSSKGMFSLLEECKTPLPPEHILKPFKRLFLAGFHGILVPRLYDADYQGITKYEGGDETPLHLLVEGAALIRRLFVQVLKNQIAILPHLPPEFFAGRFIHINCAPYGKLHLEWTKKSIRRVVFESHQEQQLHFLFPRQMKEFRLTEGRKEKGKIITAGEPMAFKSGTLYLLDRFQK